MNEFTIFAIDAMSEKTIFWIQRESKERMKEWTEREKKKDDTMNQYRKKDQKIVSRREQDQHRYKKWIKSESFSRGKNFSTRKIDC